MRQTFLLVLLLVGITVGPAALNAQPLTSPLPRGLVAVKVAENEVSLSWRLLLSDPDGVSFNVYRHRDSAAPQRANESPLKESTHFVDRGVEIAPDLTYSVRAVTNGQEGTPSPPVDVWEQNFLKIPIQTLESYRPGDASIGDLDGDGDFEIVLHQVDRPRDNSHSGLTGSPILDAYELTGEHLWRIDLGRNIREGKHYTQSMVYDLDGDGSARSCTPPASRRTRPSRPARYYSSRPTRSSSWIPDLLSRLCGSRRCTSL